MKHAQLVWFEIPVRDLSRAIRFYSAVLKILIEKHKFLDQEHAVLKREDCGVGGVLVKKDTEPRNGVMLFFYVDVLSDALESALHAGGKIITPKTLIRRTDKEGKVTIAQNLIDNRTGYYAELLDSEGNKMALYSHY